MNLILAVSAFVLVAWSVWVFYDNNRAAPEGIKKPVENVWSFRSIDTMKYSRDYAREKLHNYEFYQEINTQAENIAKTGANYLAVATPYDEEFRPFLNEWVAAARRNKLKVWFRGNWSNWEGWFGYERNMSFDEHLEKSVEFVRNNPDLFESGDKFSACPECENGAQGDPRQTGRVAEYRDFLIDESNALKGEFEKMGKVVDTSLASMNMDVARLVMDAKTAKAIGGVVTVDHYVKDPKDLAKDAREFAQNTGAKVIYGEIGVPVPDIHGKLSEAEQAQWLEEALSELVKTNEVIGISYWVNRGGSTELWSADNKPRQAVEVLEKYFKLKN